MSKLVVAISGQIVRENSANLMNFWRGFIHIQNAIHAVDELKIVAHSWNPEYDELVKKVYDVDIIESEKQQSFLKEYMPLINPVDKFEKGFKRFGSTWAKINTNMLLGQITSKTESIKLLRQLNLDEDSQVLSTRWDIGCSGGKEVNKIIYDHSLENSYFYLANFPYIDEGYADMWFISPYKYIKEFENYKNFFIETIAGKNNYFESFTKKGWVQAFQQNKMQLKRDMYTRMIVSKIIFRFPFKFFIILFPFLKNKILGLKSRLNNYLEKPPITSENSMLLNTYSHAIFPIEQSLNIHAILKYFIKNTDLREKIRFLDIKDFENLPSGQMINPIEFCYVIYSHSSFDDCWQMAIEQSIENLPPNCTKIYLVSEESEDTYNKFEKFKQNNLELLTYNDEIKYTDRLIEIFHKIFSNYEFCYFVHEDMPLIAEVNPIYLNTLLHYMNNSNEFYVKLVDTSYVDQKESHDSFPELVKNSGGYSISVQPSLFKLDFMISFLTNFHEDIYGYEQVCTRSNFTFSAVKGNKKVGKYLLINNKFPHIATAISKGKWCTSEWNDEINELAKKYNIDITLRGEC